MIGQHAGSENGASDDGVEADFSGRSRRRLRVIECSSLVRIGNMNNVASLPDIFCERRDTSHASVRMVE